LTKQQLIEKFISNPNSMNKSATQLAVRYNLTRDEVIEAKSQAKLSIPKVVPMNKGSILRSDTNFVQVVGTKMPEFTITTSSSGPVFSKEKVSDNGDREVELISDRPMTRKEIEEHYGVDNISTTLSNYWNKATASDKYLVSALIKCHHDNFYSEEELREKLKSMMTEVIPTKVVKATNTSNKICIVYLSDEHVGAINKKDDVHGNTYSADIYLGRLEQLQEKVLNMGMTYETMYVVNLGDEADSQLDGMTTRKGHALPSENGKDSFDTYVKGRRMLFETLFSSGVAANYQVINCNNSNHSGNHLSYIWNAAVGLWLETRFPEVQLINITKFIGYIEYGNHVIAFSHGKDDVDMTRNWPLVLNDKIDNWLSQWFDKLGFSSSRQWLHMRKGDLHQLAISIGKFGDYISMPSLYGSSSWIGINFGQSRPGAYIEVYDKDSPDIVSKMIWFK